LESFIAIQRAAAHGLDGRSVFGWEKDLKTKEVALPGRWPIELILLRAANPVLQPLDELARERVTTLFASPDAPCPPGASPDGTRPYLAN
jgi:hypothetical protein